MTPIDNMEEINIPAEQLLSTPSLNVLIEPTSSCNLNCNYCYKGLKSKLNMTMNTLETVMQKVISYNEKRESPSSFVWHGGEPTMVGVDFYERAFTFIENLNCRYKVSHTLQTNGTLLTDDLLDLFARHGVSIGVSLDGPPDYHNRMRPLCNGGDSHDKVIRGIERAKSKGISIGILMSITNDNGIYIKEVFDYARLNGFTFGLNPVTADLHSPHSEVAVTPENYLSACIEAYDLWLYQNDSPIQVNPGFGVTRLLLSNTRLSDCFMSENCQKYFISIGPEGDIYPCNRFYGLENYKFGNILADDFEMIMNGQKRLSLLNRSASNIAKCRDCSIYHYCNGGCMHHAIAHNGMLNSPDHLCVTYRGLIEHAVKRLSVELPYGGKTNAGGYAR